MIVWTVRRKLNQLRQVCTPPSATSDTAHPDKPVGMNMHAQSIFFFFTELDKMYLYVLLLKTLSIQTPTNYKLTFNSLVVGVISCTACHCLCISSTTFNVQQPRHDEMKLNSVRFLCAYSIHCSAPLQHV